MMTEYLSKKLRWLSILMTVLVVIIHAFNFGYHVDRGCPPIHHLYYALSIDVGRSAVPLFFFISGLLFFKDGDAFTFNFYKTQLWKRVKTVLIPFLSVSALFMFLVWLSYRSFVPHYLHLNYLLPEYSVKWILEAWIIKPQAYYLWFLRNLFALSLFSPLVYFIVKKGSWFVIVPSVLAWMFFPQTLPSPTLSVVFFMLGAFISIKQIELPKKISAKWLGLSIMVWLSFVIQSKFIDNFSDLTILISYNIYTFLGIVIAWLSYDYISPRFVERVSTSLLARYIFSVYLFHHVFLTLFQQATIYFAGSNSIAVVLPIYYISIPLSIGLAIGLAMLLEKFVPVVYRVIVGSR